MFKGALSQNISQLCEQTLLIFSYTENIILERKKTGGSRNTGINFEDP